MIKVLHILSALGGGGIENMLLNYYSNMQGKDIRFDLLAHKNHNRNLQQAFENLGARCFYITSQRESIRKNRKELKKFLSERSYDIIHFHHGIMSLGAGIAKKYAGNAKIIVHSHGTFEPNPAVRIFKPLIRRFIVKNSDFYFACGIAAGKYLFGKNFNGFYIVKNAIDTEKFKYSEKFRGEIRSRFNIEKDKVIIGTVGRLSHAKNPEFIIELIKELKNRKADFKFLWIGGGELEDRIRAETEKEGLKDIVISPGSVTDVYKYYSAMDIFILPSRYEGVGIAAVEAQQNGMPVFLSKNISAEASIAPSCVALPLDVCVWADKIYSAVKEGKFERGDYTDFIKQAGYDIKSAADDLAELYAEIIGK